MPCALRIIRSMLREVNLVVVRRFLTATALNDWLHATTSLILSVILILFANGSNEYTRIYYI